jgi:hypothetical protein
MIYGVLILAMSIEQNVEIKVKSKERWHADKTEIVAGISAAGLLVASHFPIFGEAYAALALMVATVDLVELKNKADLASRSRKQTRKQNSPSRQLPM